MIKNMLVQHYIPFQNNGVSSQRLPKNASPESVMAASRQFQKCMKNQTV